MEKQIPKAKSKEEENLSELEEHMILRLPPRLASQMREKMRANASNEIELGPAFQFELQGGNQLFNQPLQTMEEWLGSILEMKN